MQTQNDRILAATVKRFTEISDDFNNSLMLKSEYYNHTIALQQYLNKHNIPLETFVKLTK